MGVNVGCILFGVGILGSCIWGWCMVVLGVLGVDCILEIFLECWKVLGSGLVIFILLLGDMFFWDDCVM